ncbi:CDP-diacylglycerol--serine O-phosphatidyltransferase [Ostreibacterium oceani]|uniref:CDP-diacylglycerol--serine O-phosphatidyltransferase n=1 Tax=Ostreibacterium oceani TaxID=2654998 RepID=A0A6N7ERF9_9GAMM|nr:CDP-diacylglycerol--serine O-phosphatidyltransferase [Ostreibacterium oceani]MPV85121.1 CDP-diacylglycerol--serine O-phosphatidyltransferase [Ostreibacterium oceani]
MNRPPREKKNGVYLLPNLITTAALMAGFYGILSAINREFETAAICIFVAMLLDGLDGRVARLIGAESAFGEQFDSLADLLSFGAAPAIIMYLWSLHTTEHISWLPERLSWIIPFIYCACTALRLARFNSQIAQTNPNFFIGLPSPSAAGTVAGFIWLGTEFSILGGNVVFLSIIITLFCAVMMVAPIKYYSFKNISLKSKMPFLGALALVLVFALISINPATVLFSIFLIYSLHGPIRKSYRVLKRYRK